MLQTCGPSLVHPKMSDQAAYRSPRNATATLALALVAVLSGMPSSATRDIAMAADKSAWLGRWVIAAETCQNDGYDMLIEPDHFEIWEQACDIKNWSIKGDRATLALQCFNEGNATTRESREFIARGNTIERVGADASSNKMVRCK
jgi:hypothetical protein